MNAVEGHRIIWSVLNQPRLLARRVRIKFVPFYYSVLSTHTALPLRQNLM